MKQKFKYIRYRIELAFIAVAVFQIFVTGIFAVFHLKPYIAKLYEEHQGKMTEGLFWEIGNVKRDIEACSVNIIGDREIQDFLENAASVESEPGSFGLPTRLRNRVLSYINYDNRIKGIYIADNYGRIYSNAISLSAAAFIRENEKTLLRMGAKPLWSTDYSGKDIVLCRAVNNNTTDLNRREGVLLIVMDRDIFLEPARQFLSQDEEKYALASKDGHVSMGDVAKVGEIEKNPGKYMVQRAEGPDLRLTTWIDKAVAYKPVYTIFQILLSEAAVLFLLSTGLIVYLSGRLTKPISDIRAAMKQMGKGKIGVEVPVTGSDEISELAETMNRMSKRIEDLVRRITEEQKKQRLLELKAMQYQINPHFLYNTLDSINMSARKNNDIKSSELVTSLSNFFRMSLSQGQEFIRIRDEVRYARYYLDIQNIRFPDQLKWEFDVEEELLDHDILKFILQPLIENSINHGIRNLEGRGMIWVRISSGDQRTGGGRTAGDGQEASGGQTAGDGQTVSRGQTAGDGRIVSRGQIFIEVRDNGIGMPPEELTRLRDTLEQEENPEKDPFAGGFGMRNVHQRLKLYYGEQSGLNVESVWEEGTAITIRIPLSGEKDGAQGVYLR